MDLGQKNLTRVGSGQPPMNQENIPPKPQFFPFRWKKISMGWVKKYPGQKRVGLFFTAGQKYARVGLGRVRAHL